MEAAMATERQIAANRANAKKSTGPKTAAGKIRSSCNAFRHGLSRPMPEDMVMLTKIEAIARAIAYSADGEHQQAFARSQLELQRIRDVRTSLFTDAASGTSDVCALRRLAALDRYERLARTKRRRAKMLLGPSD
jgi:hypothetical protein